MVVGAVVCTGLRELDDVSDLQVGEFDALDSVAVAFFAVAQIGLIVIITCALAAQGVNNTSLVIDTGGDIRGIPNAVLLGIGKVIFVNGNGAGTGSVNSSVLHGCCGDTNRNGQTQNQCQTQGNSLFQIFHCKYPFRFHFLILEMYGMIITGTAKARDDPWHDWCFYS